MFDLQGNVIGINSQILSPTGGNVGIGFAIPAEEAKPVVDQLMKGTTITRGYLGIQMQDVTSDIADALGIPKNGGTLVARVEPGQAAEKAGIKQGDVIVKVNGQDVNPDQTLSYLVANARPGTRVPIELIRDGKRQNVTVTVGTRPSEEQLAQFDPDDNGAGPGDDDNGQATGAASLGVAVQPLTAQIARSVGVDPSVGGVVVLGVDQNSDAAGKGLRRGDVIVSVNRTPVTSSADIARITAQAKAAGRKSVLLYVQRRNIGNFVPVQIGAN
jgi:serine protease Do